MSGRYAIGETKVRPGIYFHESSANEVEIPGATNGVVAVAFKANWGPLGEIISLSSYNEIAKYFGDDSGSGSNVNILSRIFRGGASIIKAVRVGSGGTKAAITLKDTTSGTAVDAVTLTAKFPGTRALSVTIKDSLSVATLRECIIYSGTTKLTEVSFEKGNAGEVDALVAAINGNADSVVVATKVADGNGLLAAVTNTTFTTAGVSPTITNSDYSAAFTLLEASAWNVLCVDSDDTTIHALVAAFIKRATDSGLMGLAVVGEPTSVAFATRKSHAAAFNDPTMIYVANGFGDDNENSEGWKAAAYAAGYIAYLPCNDSVTHKVISGATKVVGALTNTEIIEALQSGCLVFTVSASGNIWIEQGINTLVVLNSEQDKGWKKIRRAKTRYELIDRTNIATEGIVGNVNNDENGQDTFIAAAKGVVNAMIAEHKLVEGTVTLNPAYTPEGDSAWFVFDVVDLDSMEHIYINYLFHFRQTTGTAEA